MNVSPIEAIASAAAQLVVDEGMEYSQAKRKAAQRLGRRQRGAAELPSNQLVEDEVRAYLDLFCADTQPDELRALRQLALHWMLRLAEFRPHLSGAVWRGTATRLSSIHIDLYCDDAKGAEIALINLGVDYDVSSGSSDTDVHYLSLGTRCAALNELVTLHLAVRDLDAMRGALKPDARGRSWRGDTAALQRLLATQSPMS
jgi:hypothetical protein